MVPVGCVPAWEGMLIRGCGIDMEAGMPALMPTVVPPPTGPTPIPGTARPIGAIPGSGTTVMGCAGIEDRVIGSPKPEGMGLRRIWLSVGGTGWLTWNGLA